MSTPCAKCDSEHGAHYECPRCGHPTPAALKLDIQLVQEAYPDRIISKVSLASLASFFGISCAAAKRRVTNCGKLVTVDRLEYASKIHYLANGRRGRLYRGEYQVQYSYGRPWVPYCGVGAPK